MSGTEKCIFCLKNFETDEKPTTLTQKGVNGLIKASENKERKILPLVGDKV